MTYTGSVTPGGPSAVRTLDGLTIRKASVSEMDNNVYLLTCAGPARRLWWTLRTTPPASSPCCRRGQAGSTCSSRHTSTGTTTGPWPRCWPRRPRPVRPARRRRCAPGPPDRRLEHGDTLTFGDVTLDVIHLRGHTPGSIALAWTEPSGATHVFTGDSLFPGGVGNVNKDPERFASLLADVEERIFDRYDDRTWVYPGHGADTTLGAERPHLQEWRARGW